MNLEQLRGAWQAQDEALNEHLKLNNRLLRELLLVEHRRELRRKGWLARLELISWAPAVLLLALYNWTQRGDWAFLWPGLLLQIWVTFIPLLSIRQRAALQAVDFTQPVLVLQRRIEALRLQRLHTFKWAFLVGQVIWFVPFLIVFFKGVFGVDLYAKPGWVAHFMLPNIAVGLLLIPLVVLLARWLGPRLRASSRLRRFSDLLAGRDMRAAQDFLERLRRFESGD